MYSFENRTQWTFLVACIGSLTTLIYIAVALVAINNYAAAASFQLKVIVQDGDVIDGKTLIQVNTPIANNSGDVVFQARFSEAGVVKVGIFSTTRLLAQSGQTIDGKTLRIPQTPQINDNGDVIFLSPFDDAAGIGFGIFTPDRLLFATGQNVDGKIISGSIGQGPQINNSKEIAFVAGVSETTGGMVKAAILKNDNVLAMAGQAIGDFTIDRFPGGLTLNNTGEVAFIAEDTSLTNNRAAFVTNGTLIQPLVERGDTIAARELVSIGSSNRGISLNDNGEFSFTSTFTPFLDPNGIVNLTSCKQNGTRSQSDATVP